MFLRLLEIVLTIVALTTLITQILIPLVMGIKLFPAFRRSRVGIENQIRELQSQLDEKELQDHLEELRAKLNPPAAPPTQLMDARPGEHTAPK